jgi:preprotein translocase subunit SecB
VKVSESEKIEIGIAKIYLKDLSFESPRSPDVFQKEFRPEIKLNFKVQGQKIDDTHHEVVLEVFAEAKQGDLTQFIVEVEQAGLFLIKGGTPQAMKQVINDFCPTTLFPYARQAIDHVLLLGGFPPLNIGPVNFQGMKQPAAEKN